MWGIILTEDGILEGGNTPLWGEGGGGRGGQELHLGGGENLTWGIPVSPHVSNTGKVHKAHIQWRVVSQ